MNAGHFNVTTYQFEEINFFGRFSNSFAMLGINAEKTQVYTIASYRTYLRKQS